MLPLYAAYILPPLGLVCFLVGLGAFALQAPLRAAWAGVAVLGLVMFLGGTWLFLQPVAELAEEIDCQDNMACLIERELN